MPKQTESMGTRLLNQFRNLPLETADLLLGVARDIVRERKQQAAGETVAPTPAKKRAKRLTKAAKLAKLQNPPDQSEVKALGS